MAELPNESGLDQNFLGNRNRFRVMKSYHKKEAETEKFALI